MDRALDHLAGMPDAPRALYRSGHIYILFSALLNLVLGVYMTLRVSRIARVVQYLGSLLLFSALLMFLYGFFGETPLAQVERPVTREAIYLSFAGVLLHGMAGFLGAERRVSR